eukprot:IDg9743t1
MSRRPVKSPSLLVVLHLFFFGRIVPVSMYSANEISLFTTSRTSVVVVPFAYMVLFCRFLLAWSSTIASTSAFFAFFVFSSSPLFRDYRAPTVHPICRITASRRESRDTCDVGLGAGGSVVERFG